MLMKLFKTLSNLLTKDRNTFSKAVTIKILTKVNKLQLT